MKCDTASFCVLPWVLMNVNPDGVATLCCQSHDRIHAADGRELNLQTHPMDEIWNSEGMKNIRRKMTAGESLHNCTACYDNESYGRVSYRQESNKQWLEDDPRAEAIRGSIEKSIDGTALHLPSYFDLRLGNICNLKCTACKPLYSSQIERDAVHARWSKAYYHRLAHRFATTGDWSAAEELVDEIVKMASEVSLIQLAGGEPTINRTQIALLQKLVVSGKAAQIDLQVVTNLTSVREEIYELFSKFRSLSVSVSIDGCDATYEYVRYPGKWPSLVRNVAQLRARCAGARIGVNAVLQAINATNVVNLFEWADESDIAIDLSIGRGLDLYNDFRIVPLSVRAEVSKSFDAFFSRRASKNRVAIQKNIHSIFDEMNATDFSETDRHDRVISFMHFVNDMDKSRRLSFKHTAPVIYEALVDEIGYWNAETRYT